MQTTIQKWGNSHGVRLPKFILDDLDMRENDSVVIEQTQDAIVIKKVAGRHKTLAERMAGFDGYEFEEWDTGKPVGLEVL